MAVNRLAATLAVVFLAVPAGAGEYLTQGPYPDGYSEDGYTARGGLFYKGDVPYTRSYVEYTKSVPYTTYSSYGGYGYSSYPVTAYKNVTYYRWVYHPVQVAEYKPPEVPSYAPGWRNRLLDIAQGRDKLEGQLRTAALDHGAYVSALQALGLNGNFRLAGYGAAPSYPSYAPPHNYAPYVAPQGQTVMGYSYSTVKDLYGQDSLNTLYQQASRLTSNAQTLAGQANSDFSNLVSQEGGNRARVAEVLAAGQAAVAALNAARPSASAHEQRTYSFRLEQAANGGSTLVPVESPGAAPQEAPKAPCPQPGQAPLPLPPAPGAQPQRQQGPQTPPPMPQADGRELQALSEQRCLRCHGASEPRGGFKVLDYPGMSPADKTKVWRRITAKDDTRMPPPDAGPPLTPAEVRLFLTH